MSHTSGTWRVEYRPGTGRVPATIWLMPAALYVGIMDDPVAEANARRIVRCVNALKGCTAAEIDAVAQTIRQRQRGR